MWASDLAPPPASTSPTDRPARAATRAVGSSVGCSIFSDLPRTDHLDPRAEGGRAGRTADEHQVGLHRAVPARWRRLGAVGDHDDAVALPDAGASPCQGQHRRRSGPPGRAGARPAASSCAESPDDVRTSQ